MRFKSLLRAIRLYRNGGAIGDIAILKTDAFRARATAAVETQLADVRGYAPAIDLDDLRALPEGTLGREYARFLDDRGLQPFVITDAIEPEILARNTFGHRVALTHDMFHVLTGFDSSLPGELGVLAFTSAQGYSRAQRYVALPLAVLLYPLVNPTRIRSLFRCLRAGWRMGKRARFVLGRRLEEQFATPVNDIRSQLDIAVSANHDHTRHGYLPVQTG